MKKQGDKFEVGDRVVCLMYGFGTVAIVDPENVAYTVKVETEIGSNTYTADGRWDSSDASITLYHANQGVIEIDTDEPVVPEDLKLDQPLVVSHHGGDPLNRHFAKFENDKVYCWGNGKTSHTTTNITPWDHWRLPKAAPCP